VQAIPLTSTLRPLVSACAVPRIVLEASMQLSVWDFLDSHWTMILHDWLQPDWTRSYSARVEGLAKGSKLIVRMRHVAGELGSRDEDRA